MEVAEFVRPTDNGLSSDVLRVRTAEYYTSCLPEGRIYKSGSMTHINGYSNGISGVKKFGHPDMRASYGVGRNGTRPFPPAVDRLERPHRTHSDRTTNRILLNVNSNSTKVGLYRSNSSLDLDHGDDAIDGSLRRDYGSASSLDVISTTGESFFAMLREFQGDGADQRSPGPAKIQEYLRGKVESAPALQNASNALANGSDSLEDAQSPKLKNKFHKLLELKDRSKSRQKLQNSEPSLFRKLRGNRSESTDSNAKADTALDLDNRLDEKLRKKAFSHYDCQSITANLSYASRLRNLLSKRRNTTTGASAASMLNRTPNGSMENLDPEEADGGDGKNSHLIQSCPFFRNELGGEEERIISLNRITCHRQRSGEESKRCLPTLHRPNIACGLSVLESSQNMWWKNRMCPYQRTSHCIESVDQGAAYYRSYFHGQEHLNWFGVDENLGPVAVSIKREKLEDSETCTTNQTSNGHSSLTQSQHQYRLILRTSELAVLRGTVLEEAIPSLCRSSPPRGIHTREVLEYIAPELQHSCLRLGTNDLQTEEQLMKLDQQGLTKTYKVGVMYCKAGQSSEEEMYNNEHSGPAFEEFLEMLGERVRLKGFDKYRAGLDNKTDTTGLYSIYSSFQDCEIMYHVSTLLPYTPNNRQQLLRKRHIGNDIVTIVFQEPDALPFTPKNIRSHFQHVFIVVRAINPCTDNTRYSVAVSRSKEVQVFGPPIPEGGTFPKNKAFTEFILTKVINAENAAHRSEKFATMAQRTRQEYLKDLASNHSTNTTIDSGPKFSILSFGGKKKERVRPRFIPNAIIQGAIAWQVQVEDYGQSAVLDCLLGISADTFVLVDENTRETVFACPTASIIGWSSHSGSLKLFYHQGECVVLKTKDPEVDEIQEIVTRLGCVTTACETQELILRRNSLGQLGFHVQYEGIVTEVESYGFAWQAGLRKGSRLVEICKVAVATLTYDQMVDLLKTSMTVSVTVVPSLPDGAPRRGCNLHNCSYLSTGTGDYENISTFDHEDNVHPSRNHAVVGQQVPSNPNRATRYENHFAAHQSNNHSVAGRTYSHEPRIPNNEPLHMSAAGSRNEVRHLMTLYTSDYSPPPPPIPARTIPTPDSAFGRLPNPPSPEIPPSASLPPFPTAISPHCSPAHPHRGLHDHTSLTHVGSMVASRSELSLAQLTPSRYTPHSHYSLHSELNFSPHVKNQTDLKLASRSPSLSRDQNKGRGLVKPHSSHLLNSDYHSDSSNEWPTCGTGSADELSGGSSHRSTPPRSSSYRNDLLSSRNNSPRIATRTPSDIGHSKLSRLRPGVTSGRLPKNNAACSSNSSSSGSSSTLQEDLLKLISPDYLDSDSNSEEPSSVPSESGSHTQLSTPYSSLERGTTSSSSGISASGRLVRCNGLVESSSGDVILTKAQPAQVIASEPSSPAPQERKLTREERLSPRVTSDVVINKMKPLPPTPTSLIPLPEGRDIDWPSLVDTATKAMEVGRSLSKGTWVEENLPKKEISSGQQGKNMYDLEAKVVKLQHDLVKEQIDKATLEQQVRNLQEENQRLHEESQSATAQLRKLTEWFFNTMESSS